MFWNDKVIWEEGMFLRAQHFQQQDRYWASRVQARAEPLRPYPWGFTDLALNRELLAGGRLALSSAAGILPDGTSFSIPGQADLPKPLEVPEGARNVEVHLAVPLAQDGVPEVKTPGDGPDDLRARFVLRGFQALDTHSDSTFGAELSVGRLALRYLLGSEDLAGYARIGIARIVEVQSDRRVILDESYIPSCLRVSAAPALATVLPEFLGMIEQRSRLLADQTGQPGTGGSREASNFMLLQTLNRWRPLLAHWSETGYVHPEDLYATLIQLAGELATFTTTHKLASQYPPYRHEDLQASFAPVFADLRRSLARVLETNIFQIPLEEPRFGIRAGLLQDRGLLRNAQFVLAVSADIPGEELRRLFPHRVKVGAVEVIQKLVNVAMAGIGVMPLPVAPPQLPFRTGAAYFELDQSGPQWQLMSKSGGFGIHVSDADDFHNLRMELWAIRA